jgi:hypothetical protein
MQAKRPYLAADSIRNPRKVLKALYAQRSAVDALIQSLQEYNRHRTKRFDPAWLKTA